MNGFNHYDGAHTNGHRPVQAEPVDYGPCCACGKHDGTVQQVVSLNRLAPIAGTGWECTGCGLPPNGAMAVVCTECLAKREPLKNVIYGPLGSHDRFLVGDLSEEVFDHKRPKFRRPSGPFRGT